MNITAQDKLRAQIEAAFADTPAPGDDDDDISRTAIDEGIADYFRFTTWHGHNAYALSYHEVALTFFTDKAFRYWLPAFMLAELETPEGVPDIVEKLGYALAWPSRLPAFAPDELEAMAAFLHECVRKYSAPDGTCDADLQAAERAVQTRLLEVQSGVATEPSCTLPLRASVIVSRAAALEPFAAHLRTAERHVYNELVQLGAQVRWAESHAVSVRFTHRHRANHDDLLSLQQLRHLGSIDYNGL